MKFLFLSTPLLALATESSWTHAKKDDMTANANVRRAVKEEKTPKERILQSPGDNLVYRFTGPPVPIPDNGFEDDEFARVRFTISTTGCSIADINVRVDIDHPSVDELIMALDTPPLGFVNLLPPGSGQGGISLTPGEFTTFDDSAGSPSADIDGDGKSWSTPGFGLNQLAGLDPSGDWELLLADLSASYAGGTLDQFEIEVICAPSNIEVITDRDTFISRYPNLALEDFEGGNVEDVADLECSNPLVGGQEDTCFPEAETVAGFELSYFGSACELFVYGEGFFTGQSSTWVGPDERTSSIQLLFPAGDVNAVGFDWWDPQLRSSTVTVSLFAASGLIGAVSGSVISSPSFFGVVSNEPISYIQVDSSPFLLDNLVFGSAETETDSPTAAPSDSPSTSPSTSTSPSAAPTLIKERCLSCDQDDKGKVTFCRNGKTTMKIPSQAVEAIVSSSDDCICGACPELN